MDGYRPPIIMKTAARQAFKPAAAAPCFLLLKILLQIAWSYTNVSPGIGTSEGKFHLLQRCIGTAITDIGNILDILCHECIFFLIEICHGIFGNA